MRWRASSGATSVGRTYGFGALIETCAQRRGTSSDDNGSTTSDHHHHHHHHAKDLREAEEHVELGDEGVRLLDHRAERRGRLDHLDHQRLRRLLILRRERRVVGDELLHRRVAEDDAVLLRLQPVDPVEVADLLLVLARHAEHVAEARVGLELEHLPYKDGVACRAPEHLPHQEGGRHIRKAARLLIEAELPAQPRVVLDDEGALLLAHRVQLDERRLESRLHGVLAAAHRLEIDRLLDQRDETVEPLVHLRERLGEARADGVALVGARAQCVDQPRELADELVEHDQVVQSPALREELARDAVEVARHRGQHLRATETADETAATRPARVRLA